jgi:D-alanine-D-alanine ligase
VSEKRTDFAVLVDEEVGRRDRAGRFIVDRGTMEDYVLKALEAQGSTAVVPFLPQITPTIDTLRALKPRLVFNLTEWLGGNRRLDSAIAGVLEMMKLRYTGSSPEAMHLARDKALAKEIVSKLGIDVARGAVVNGTVKLNAQIAYPIIVKPQFGDGSDEIGKTSLVRSERGLKTRVAEIRGRTREPLLCEEFVEGRDLFVGLLGNVPKVMPPLELVVGRRGNGAPLFATSKVKNDAVYRAKWRVGYRMAELPQHVRKNIEAASRRIFHALKLRDYARIDYRLTSDNRVVFLEANPNPDLTPHTFGRDCCFAGVAYPELISRIVGAALARPR